MYVLEDYYGSLNSHGFEHIFIFFLHSGNFPDMNAILISIAANLETQLISQLEKKPIIDSLIEGLAGFDIDQTTSGQAVQR